MDFYIFSQFHYKSQFLIAMLNYQRVIVLWLTSVIVTNYKRASITSYRCHGAHGAPPCQFVDELSAAFSDPESFLLDDIVHDTVDGCEILHHQKDGWSPINNGMLQSSTVSPFYQFLFLETWIFLHGLFHGYTPNISQKATNEVYSVTQLPYHIPILSPWYSSDVLPSSQVSKELDVDIIGIGTGINVFQYILV
jgi:hypothetical protein